MVLFTTSYCECHDSLNKLILMMYRQMNVMSVDYDDTVDDTR